MTPKERFTVLSWELRGKGCCVKERVAVVFFLIFFFFLLALISFLISCASPFDFFFLISFLISCASPSSYRKWQIERSTARDWNNFYRSRRKWVLRWDQRTIRRMRPWQRATRSHCGNRRGVLLCNVITSFAGADGQRKRRLWNLFCALGCVHLVTFVPLFFLWWWLRPTFVWLCTWTVNFVRTIVVSNLICNGRILSELLSFVWNCSII